MIAFTTPECPTPSSRPVVRSATHGAGHSDRIASLGDEIARLSAHIEAANARLLDLIRLFDESEGWYAEGFKSCADWLGWRTGIGPGAAREKVRVARALGDLPALSAALGTGALSYSAARAITRVATPETDAELVETARHVTAADLERLVSAWRAADRADSGDDERHARRSLTVIPDTDGSWRIRGRLDPEVGAALCKALEAFESAWTEDAVDAEDETPEARRADALARLVEAAMSADSIEGDAANENRDASRIRSERRPATRTSGRYEVVVHVSAETLSKNGSGVGEIEHGPHVSAETSRRLACDAGIVSMTEDASGAVLNVGRRRRSVPAALRRALERRDRTCRFPGCRARYCDAHHITHWADGGETSLDNLVLLCRTHHRRVHEEGWSVELYGTPGRARFTRPDGTELPDVPRRPVAPKAPVRALLARNAKTGVDIGPWTATPDWLGDRLDLDWALFVLRPTPPRRGPSCVGDTDPAREPRALSRSRGSGTQPTS